VADRRGSRFAFEVLFLVALTVAVTVAELRPVAIAGILLLGWLLVAGIEWAAWRDEPHYSSGLPPRWYVPRVDLPPAQPLESVVSGYPEGRRAEAPTWIATASLREELLGEWPLAAPYDEPEASGAAAGDQLDEQVPENEAWTAIDLPPVRRSEPEPTDLEAVPDPPPAPEPFPFPQPAPDPDPEPDLDPAADAGAPHFAAPPLDAPLLDAQLNRSAQAAAASQAGAPSENAAPSEKAPAPGLAQYSLDPLAEQPRRRFGRRSAEVGPSIIVPARPEGERALPGSARED
jgi:hypothetical protein